VKRLRGWSEEPESESQKKIWNAEFSATLIEYQRRIVTFLRFHRSIAGAFSGFGFGK
jgi:hypothetical protein